MQVTIDLKQLVIILVLIALFVLIIYAVKVLKNVSVTLGKVNDVLDDSRRVTSAAADSTEKVKTLVDDTSDTLNGIVDSVRGNSSFISTLSSLGAGAAALKNILEKFSSDSEEDYVRRARQRRAKRARARKTK